MSDRVYVATRSTNFRVVRSLYELVDEHGYVITMRWADHIEDGHDDALLTSEDCQKAALEDERGVRTADRLIFIDHPGVRGGLIEVGLAIAYKIPHYLVKLDQYTVFWDHPLATKCSMDELRRRIKDHRL